MIFFLKVLTKMEIIEIFKNKRDDLKIVNSPKE